MSFENDITSIKKLFEDNQLFKPASEDDKAERKTYDEQKYAKKLEELKSIVNPQIEELKKTHTIGNIETTVDDDGGKPIFIFHIPIDYIVVELSAWMDNTLYGWEFSVGAMYFGHSIEFPASKISKFVSRWSGRMTRTEKDAIGESKLNEDNQLFKPASPEDKNSRPKPKSSIKIIFQETVPLIYWQDLTPEEKKEFDYDVADERTFFRYRDNTYDLCSFIRTNRDGELAELGWQGVSQGTYDSGDVVKDFDNGDEITVAGFYCSSIEEAINEDNLLFKPASNDDREERQAAERARIEPLVRKQINKLRTIIFPKILDGLRSNGKVEDVEMDDSLESGRLGTIGDDSIRVHLSFTFRGHEVDISVNAAVQSGYYSSNEYYIELEFPAYKSFICTTVSGTILNIIKYSRKEDTEELMSDLRIKSKATKRVTAGAFKTVFDVGRAFINGEVAGGVTHNKNLQASIINDVLYSYATPIAIRKDGTVYEVDKKFSNTTTRLQDALRGATKISVEEFKEMLTEKGITNFGYLGENNISIKEDNNLFKPASQEDMDARPKPPEEDWQKRDREAREQRAAYILQLQNLPYTYEDITNLPEYKRIIDLPGVIDSTGEDMKRRRSIKFQLGAKSNNPNITYTRDYHVKPNGYIHVMDMSKSGFGESNYPIRSRTKGTAYTLDAYKVLLNDMYNIMVRRIKGWEKENNKVVNEDNNLFKPASSDDLNGRPKQFQFTGDDIGCYVDCSRGIYVGKRIQELAIEYGWSNDPNANSAVLDPNDESYYDATDEAEEFLNTLCDDTVYFGVNESGDFMLMKRDTE